MLSHLNFNFSEAMFKARVDSFGDICYFLDFLDKIEVIHSKIDAHLSFDLRKDFFQAKLFFYKHLLSTRLRKRRRSGDNKSSHVNEQHGLMQILKFVMNMD